MFGSGCAGLAVVVVVVIGGDGGGGGECVISFDNLLSNIVVAVVIVAWPRLYERHRTQNSGGRSARERLAEKRAN